MKPQLLAVMILASSAVQQACATITFSDVAGAAVTSVDRSANFNSVNSGDNLLTYEEGQLSITTVGTANLSIDPFPVNRDAPFYCAGINTSWVTIKTTDGRAMVGVEFLYANVWSLISFVPDYGHPDATIEWRAYLGAALVSSGSTSPNPTQMGTFVGFKDLAGFDTLLVRATLGGDKEPISQGIALDDLNVQLAPIPEPSTWLAGIALTLPFGVQVLRHVRKHKQVS